MKEVAKKVLFVLATVLVISLFAGDGAEAASWSQANYLVKTTGTVKVYKKSSTKSKKVGKLRKNVKVRIYKTKSGWGSIRYGGKTRYIKMSKTTPYWYTVKKTMYASCDTNAYQKRSTSSSYRYAAVAKNKSMYVYSKSSDGWSYISLDGKRCYIRTSALSSNPVAVKPQAPVSPAQPVQKRYKLKISNTVHSTITVVNASTGQKVLSGITEIKEGTKLKATIQVKTGYNFMRYSGVTTSNNKTVTFVMPSKDSAISAYLNCSNAGKKTYACVNDEKKMEVIYTVVAGEAGTGYNEAVAVMTTVMNRMDSPTWKTYGSDPYQQFTKKGQFTVYANMKDSNGNIKPSYKAKVTSQTKQAVKDVLAGKRSHDYCSFRTATEAVKKRYTWGVQVNTRGNWHFNN